MTNRLSLAKYYFKYTAKLHCLFFFALLLCPLFAQAQNLDSLKQELQRTSQDSNRVKVLYTIARAYLGKNPVESIKYAKQVKHLSKQLHRDTDYIKAFNQVGIGYILLGEYNKAIAELVAGLKLADSVQNHSLQGFLNLNIGLVYSKLQNSKEALKHYKAGLKHGLVVQDPRITVVSYSNIGYTYILEKKYHEAEQALQEGLKLAIAAKDIKNQGLIYSNLAMIYCQQKQYQQAEQTFIKSIDLSKQAKDSFTILGTYVDFIQFYLDTQKTAQVSQHLQEALQLAKVVGAKNFEANLYELYTQYYRSLGNFEKALGYKEKAIVLKDSVFSIEKNKQIAQIKANYKHEAEKLKLKQQVALEKKARQTQKAISVIALIGFAIIIIVALLLHISNQKRRKTNQQLAVQKQEAEKQRDIIEENTMEMQAAYYTLQTMHEELKQTQTEIAAHRDELQCKNEKLSWYRYRIGKSIEAAKMIQTAILPDHSCLSTCFKEYFVLYKPKDVVSGDFYWVNKQEAHTILIVADCTGHGVPGAFMSMVANTLLDNIVKVNKVYDPASILDLLHKKIKKALRQEETRNNSGMDVAIVVLEQTHEDQVQVTFAGAKRSLLYVAQDTQALEEIKGTRQPIGGIQPKRKPFEQHVLPLPLGSLLYVGSDGLSDQNNAARDKFGQVRLKSVLQTNAHLPLHQQRAALDGELQSYMQGIEQRDDILWMGVKL